MKDLTNWVLYSSDHKFWEHISLAMMQRPKYRSPLSAASMAYLYYPQQIDNNFRKRRLTPQKMRNFDENGRNICTRCKYFLAKTLQYGKAYMKQNLRFGAVWAYWGHLDSLEIMNYLSFLF